MAAGQSRAASYFSASVMAARESSCRAGDGAPGDKDGLEGCGTCSPIIGALGRVIAGLGGIVGAPGRTGAKEGEVTALFGAPALVAGRFILKDTTTPSPSNNTTIAIAQAIARDGFLSAT